MGLRAMAGISVTLYIDYGDMTVCLFDRRGWYEHRGALPLPHVVVNSCNYDNNLKNLYVLKVFYSSL